MADETTPAVPVATAFDDSAILARLDALEADNKTLAAEVSMLKDTPATAAPDEATEFRAAWVDTVLAKYYTGDRPAAPLVTAAEIAGTA